MTKFSFNQILKNQLPFAGGNVGFEMKLQKNKIK